MIHIAICEDNKSHLEQISNIVSDICPNAEIAQFYTSEQREELCCQNAPDYDIVLMDIELPKSSGILLAKKIYQFHPCTQIIFITQYLQFCKDVYETDHVYFVYKQDMKEYLPLAIEKALQKRNHQKLQYLTISWNRHQHYLLFQSIVYMERSLRTTKIRSISGEYYTSEKLTDLLERLDQSFICCHRSFLINLNYITNFDDELIILQDQYRIPVSQKYRTEVRQKFFEMALTR